VLHRFISAHSVFSLLNSDKDLLVSKIQLQSQASWCADPADLVIVSLAVTSNTKSNSLLLSVWPVFILAIWTIRIPFRRVLGRLKSRVTRYVSVSFAYESFFIFVN
jgi:hypothetical protein